MQSSSRPASTSTRPPHSPLPRQQHHVNTGTKVLDTTHGRILCIADIRGRLSSLNDLAREANAQAIIHTGDFGFFEANSLERINDRTLRHLTQYSPLIPNDKRRHLLAAENTPQTIRATVNISLLSEFPLLLSGQIKLQVPVYTVWGTCEDVLVLEKFRAGSYAIDNLHVLDEATTRCVDVGGVKLRLLGLGGALVPHKMFDNGDGNATIAGGQGTMWTTALQIGELVDTAQRVFDPSETRVLVTHTSPGREGIMAQLALSLKADLTISAGLHFRYATSYNEFSIQGDFEGFRHKLLLGKEAFDKVWESVKAQVEAVVDDHQRVLLEKALSVTGRLPPQQPSTGPGASATGEEPAWKNCWNWNLTDAAYGTLVLDVKEGRVSAELKSQGFNYAYRRSATMAPTPTSATSALPGQSHATTQPPTKGSTPAPERVTPQPAAATPAPVPAASSTPGEKEVVSPKVNGSGMPTTPTSAEKAKKKERKDRKDKDRGADKAAGAAAEKGDVSGSKDVTGTPKSTTSTPALPDSASVTEAHGASKPSGPSPGEGDESALKSPVTDETRSSGVRTPKGVRPSRNPWTIFMRMTLQLPITEAEIREFFADAKDGIIKVHLPPQHPTKPRIAYVEFGDEEAMKAGLEKHAEKLKDTVPEVKQAQDRESRENHPHRGGFRGRGRGGSGGGYAARGFAAAGLTRGGHRNNGDRQSTDTAKSSGAPAPAGSDAAA